MVVLNSSFLYCDFRGPLIPQTFSISLVPILPRACLAFRLDAGYLKLELLGLDSVRPK